MKHINKFKYDENTKLFTNINIDEPISKALTYFKSQNSTFHALLEKIIRNPNSVMYFKTIYDNIKLYGYIFEIDKLNFQQYINSLIYNNYTAIKYIYPINFGIIDTIMNYINNYHKLTTPEGQKLFKNNFNKYINEFTISSVPTPNISPSTIKNIPNYKTQIIDMKNMFSEKSNLNWSNYGNTNKANKYTIYDILNSNSLIGLIIATFSIDTGDSSNISRNTTSVNKDCKKLISFFNIMFNLIYGKDCKKIEDIPTEKQPKIKYLKIFLKLIGGIEGFGINKQICFGLINQNCKFDNETFESFNITIADLLLGQKLVQKMINYKNIIRIILLYTIISQNIDIIIRKNLLEKKKMIDELILESIKIMEQKKEGLIEGLKIDLIKVKLNNEIDRVTKFVNNLKYSETYCNDSTIFIDEVLKEYGLENSFKTINRNMGVTENLDNMDMNIDMDMLFKKFYCNYYSNLNSWKDAFYAQKEKTLYEKEYFTGLQLNANDILEMHKYNFNVSSCIFEQFLGIRIGNDNLIYCVETNGIKNVQ